MKYFLRVLFLSAILLSATIPLVTLAQEEPVDESAEINIKNADISAVIRIFSRKTKKNYILDERVKGQVSIYLPGKIPAEESQRILDAVLQLKGFTSVPVGENLWKVIPAKEAIQSTIPTLRDDDEMIDPTATTVTRLFQLKYVGADAAKELIQPLIGSNGLINAYTGTNSLMIIDSGDNIERIVDIIETMDVSATDQELMIIPIEYADAIDIASKLQDILNSNDSKDTSPASNRAASIRSRINNNNNQNPVATTSSTTVQARAKEPKIIADERTNSIILVADEDSGARIRALISQLDSEVDRSGFRFYVYRCQHVNAEEVADVLSGLGGGGTGGSTGSGLSRTSNNRNSTSATNSQGRNSSQRRSPGQSRSTSGSTGSTSSNISSAAFGDEVSITADPTTNALIIYSGKSDYKKILELLVQLDIKRKQVLVEAMLLEVSIDDTLSASTEFISSGGGQDGGIFAQSAFTNNLATLLSDPRQLSNFTVAAASSGSLTLPGDITIPTQSILLSAAANNSNVNVLSAPNILATDNEPAEIVVGSNVPFIASTSTSDQNLNNTFNTVDRQDVGITLRLTPQISSNDTVRLDIFTEVSNVVDSTANSDLGPTTTVRTSETTAITKDAQTVVIGGLMADSVSDVDTGIPFLKDVPILGHLFRSSVERESRTNLLIFITPRIIKDQFDHRDSTIEGRDDIKVQMDENKLYPSRDEMLFAKGIDQVAEIEEFTGKKPSPIRALKASRLKPSSKKTSKIDKDAIELKIKPKFPVAKSKVKASLKRGQYIVFDIVQGDSELKLPFVEAGKEDSYAVVYIPTDTQAKSKEFFQAGDNYRYAEKTSLKALGTFNDIKEVQELFPEASKPYILSPYEIMNLGSGPWRKGA